MEFHTKYGPWAFVTGASSGLGKCYAKQLAAKGLNLLLLARRGDRLEILAEEIRDKHQVEVRCMAMDLLADDALSQIQSATAELEIGLLVNNAGFGFKGGFLTADASLLRDMVRLNCELPTLLCHLLLPAMMERGRGGVINLASAASFQPTPYMSVYGATKGYDLLLSEALSVEMKSAGVDLIAVCPGTTNTEFHAVAGGVATFGGMADPDDVVSQSLHLLGRKISFLHGLRNKLLCFPNRLVPRSWVAAISGKVIQASTKETRGFQVDRGGCGDS
ncbi:MAG: SDR family oxidoreductase [Planctomycetota bacterium]|nr:SDR family oxidoreductase [Planctomycetota bacterium]